MNARHLASRVASRYLLSKDRYERETGQKLPRWKQKLDEYEKKGNLFIHFTFVPKLGVYPNNKYDTPTGFYAYPLRYAHISDFATNRPYGVILAPKPGANILRISQYGDDDLQRDIAKLRERHAISDQDIGDWSRKSRIKSPAGMLWNITRNLSQRLGGKSVHRWAFILWKTLGYDGVDDDRGAGVIHDNEPHQAVFFNTRALDLKDLIQFAPAELDPFGQVDTERGPAEKYVKQRAKEEKQREKERLTGQDYTGESFSGYDFSNRDLSGKIFERADFLRANLSGANLSGANFFEASLVGANLSGANLTGANLRNSDVDGANFTGANLTGADFRAEFKELIVLKGANLTRVNLQYSQLPLGTNFSNMNLTGANLSWSRLSTFIFRGANLTGANLTGAKVFYSNLVDANLSGANLSGANFKGSDLSAANLRGADLTDADLTGANLTGANLDGAKLDGVKGYYP